MTKRTKMPTDVNQRGKAIVDLAAGLVEPEPEHEKNAAAVALGRLGGQKGGKERGAKLTPERRSEIARAANAARRDRQGRTDAD